MRFDWDEDKRLANIDKHGIDFFDAKEIWEDPVLEIMSDQVGHGEVRYVALGAIEGEVIVVIYTWRRRQRRIISARKAGRREKAIYEDTFGRGAREQSH